MRIVLTILFSFFALLYAQVPYFSEAMLNNPTADSALWDKLMPRTEVPVFEQNPMVNSILLPNDYVSSKLTNTKAWPIEKKYIILGVKLIFTKYPEKFEDWRTNYYQLMADRFKALFALDPRFNDKKIPYRMVLQTNCKTEPDAEKMFHGFEILYQKTPPFTNTNSINDLKPDDKLQKYLDDKGGIKNTSVLRLFQSLKMDSTLIVIDCTGSMDEYKGNILLWLSLNMDKSNRYFSLLNDDRSISDSIGHSGGVYTGIYWNPTQVMMKYDSLDWTLGHNPDVEENNVEAILTGIEKFPFIKRVIMLADMESCVRDIGFARCISKPVHIVADGYDKYPNPHYLHIAAVSGGSFYIGNNNWITAESILSGDEITVGNNAYRYDKTKRYVIVSRKTSSYNYKNMDCTPFYDGPECK